jgi:hypothetical protein
VHTHKTIGVQRLVQVLASVRFESLAKVPQKTWGVTLTKGQESGVSGTVLMTQGAAEFSSGFLVPAAQPRCEPAMLS